MSEIPKPTNPLVEDDAEDTLTGVRDVLAAMRCINTNVDMWDRAPAGMSRICGLIYDAVDFELRKIEAQKENAHIGDQSNAGAMTREKTSINGAGPDEPTCKE